jgi:hypothetical protein
MRCVKRWCICVARPGIRDLGNDYPTRVEVCMYRTIAHLPPETLLRNEVTEVRSRGGGSLSHGRGGSGSLSAWTQSAFGMVLC